MLDRKRWSIEFFRSLSEREQNEWIAYEDLRDSTLERALDNAYKANSDGKLYPETVTAHLLTELLRLGQ